MSASCQALGRTQSVDPHVVQPVFRLRGALPVGVIFGISVPLHECLLIRSCGLVNHSLFGLCRKRNPPSVHAATPSRLSQPIEPWAGAMHMGKVSKKLRMSDEVIRSHPGVTCAAIRDCVLHVYCTYLHMSSIADTGYLGYLGIAHTQNCAYTKKTSIASVSMDTSASMRRPAGEAQCDNKSFVVICILIPFRRTNYHIWSLHDMPCLRMQSAQGPAPQRSQLSPQRRIHNVLYCGVGVAQVASCSWLPTRNGESTAHHSICRLSRPTTGYAASGSRCVIGILLLTHRLPLPAGGHAD